MSIALTHEPDGLRWTRLRSCMVAVIALLLCLTAGTRDALALSSNNVPLDNWSYAALDKLAGFGLIHSDVHGMRPYTRLEVARLVSEALDSKEEKKLELPPLIEHFLERFQREFKEELTVYGRGKQQDPAALVVKPLEEVKMDYVHSDGQPRDFLQVKGGVRQFQNPGFTGIIGTEGTPLLYNNDGIVYGKGNNFSMQFSSSFQVSDWISGYIEPIFIERENAAPGRSIGLDQQTIGSLGNSDVYLLKGYAKISPLDSEIEIGRDSMWWGQGARGTLILTNNAPPMDMLKISNPTPYMLPWIFQYLGPFKYSIFISQMNGNLVTLNSGRTVTEANPLLGGERIDFKPTPNFEIGMSRTFEFGGRGVPAGTAYDWLKIMTFLNTGGRNTDFSDQRAALDFRYRMPWLYNIETYLEWGGEDFGRLNFGRGPNNFLFRDQAFLAGIYIPKLTQDGRTDLRIEYGDNVSDQDLSFWYGHSQYISGYVYNGMLLGMPMGPDARDIFARTTHYVKENIQLGLDFDFNYRGRNLGPVVEYNYQVGADVSYEYSRNLTFKVRYAYGEIQNFDLVNGDNRTADLLMLEVCRRF